MKAIIKKVYIKHVETKAGKKFDKIAFNCDVFMPDDRVKERTAEMSVDYATKYFTYCGLTSADLPGKVCDVTLQKRSFTDKNGELRVFEEIRYLNMLDKNGEKIIMPSNNSVDMPF